MKVNKMAVMKRLAMGQILRNRRLYNCLGGIRYLHYNRHEAACCNGKRPLIQNWLRLIVVGRGWLLLVVIGRNRSWLVVVDCCWIDSRSVIRRFIIHDNVWYLWGSYPIQSLEATYIWCVLLSFAGVSHRRHCKHLHTLSNPLRQSARSETCIKLE